MVVSVGLGDDKELVFGAFGGFRGRFGAPGWCWCWRWWGTTRASMPLPMRLLELVRVISTGMSREALSATGEMRVTSAGEGFAGEGIEGDQGGLAQPKVPDGWCQRLRP